MRFLCSSFRHFENFVVSFKCTSGSSMPQFFSFRAFETNNRSLSWINIGSGNMFNSQSWLLYSVSLLPDIHLTTFFLKILQNLNFSSYCSQARETIQQYRQN